jgi:uncharacterized protein YjgD (DUF1641 family)
MGRPIVIEVPKRDAREELRARLEDAPAEHAEAILAGFEVLQGLHDRGVLELLRGALAGGDRILDIALDGMNSPESIRGIRNFVIAAKIFGAIDPEVLRTFARTVPDGLAGAVRAQQKAPPGVWATLRMLCSPNLRRGLAVMNNALDAWGRNPAETKS